MVRLLRDILDPLTYRRIGYLLVALPLGIAEFTFLAIGLLTGIGTAITLIGIPILVGTVYGWRWLATLERGILGALTGVDIPSPYRPDPGDVGWSRRLYARLSDPATWKDLAFLSLQLPLGIASFTIAVSVLGVGLGWLLAPVWYWSVSGGIDLGIAHVDTLGEALALVPLGVVVTLVGIPALGQLGRLYGYLGVLLLGSNADPVLTEQVSDLQGARSRIIAAADGERRRIERDLHDGAQQRLVALALTLRMAETRAAKGDQEAIELIRQAGDEAGLALSDLRDLARGIHPAILTNRGLPAALDDLATRATLPVRVLAAPQERLPDQLEAAAYFMVSESLANVGKHAAATHATVEARVSGDALIVEVGDDGKGGVSLGDGSGLQGLEDRVGSLDGSLSLDSPAGNGTRVRATIPLALPAPTGEGLAPARPALLPDAQARSLEARRIRGLRIRLSLLGGVAFILVVIWGLTGAPNAWPVWPLLGLSLIAALDAWLVLGGRPLRESDVSGEGDRAKEIRSLRRTKRLRLYAGALVILNLFLVGVWLAAGAGYFWPVWVILGSAVFQGLKLLRWPELAREHLMGDASELSH